MARSRSEQVRFVGGVFQALAILGIVAGVVIGWALPQSGLSLAAALSRPIAGSGVDSTTFLGAALTTLGVIVAILIGYNVAGLQTAGQLMSLALSRAMLLSLAPFLLWWTVTTGVGLVYLLEPPTHMGQLWQMLVWFAAVVLFMLAYLWTLPWRLSSEHAARWAVDDLRAAPVAQWESQDGYDVLQSSFAAATTRGDLGAVRSLAQTLGVFLATFRDTDGEREPGYHRGRYRALKNLVSGCAQFSGAAPTSVAYQLGYVAAGAVTLAASMGLPSGAPETDLFSGLMRSLDQSPDRFESLWTGVRHALCRGDAHTSPYLLRYWKRVGAWNADDPRATERVADGVMRLHKDLTFRLTRDDHAAHGRMESARMLDDLYRYVGRHLRERIEAERSSAERARMLKLASTLLDQLHTRASRLAAWNDEQRAIEAKAYERERARFEAAASKAEA